MRSHNNEHSDSLPVIDIASLRHVAYVFDALIYYMRSGTDTDTDVLKDGISVTSWQDHEETENDDHDDDMNSAMCMETESVDGETEISGKLGRKHLFFQRSDSTLFLGCPPPDPFQTPLVQALPLADQPHLLQPNSRREDLFGVAKQTVTPQTTVDVKTAPGMENVLDKLPLHLSMSMRMPESPLAPPISNPTENVPVASSSSTDGVCTTASVIVRQGTYQTTVSGPEHSSHAAIFVPISSTQDSNVSVRFPVHTSLATLSEAASQSTLSTGRSLQPGLNISFLPQAPMEKVEVHQPSVIVHSSTAMSSNVAPGNIALISVPSTLATPSMSVFSTSTLVSVPDTKSNISPVSLPHESVISSPVAVPRPTISNPIMVRSPETIAGPSSVVVVDNDNIPPLNVQYPSVRMPEFSLSPGNIFMPITLHGMGSVQI